MHTETATRFLPGNLVRLADGRTGTVESISGSVAEVEVSTGIPAHKARSIDDLFESAFVDVATLSIRSLG